jgi:hypothetical protein
MEIEHAMARSTRDPEVCGIVGLLDAQISRPLMIRLLDKHDSEISEKSPSDWVCDIVWIGREMNYRSRDARNAACYG